MNYILFTSLFCYVLLHSAPTEPYEGLPVRKIIIQVENQAPSDVDDEATVLHKLHTKMGDAFDQETFDRDLRVLSNEYEWVEPSVKVEGGQVYVSIVLRKRPVITRFDIEGTHYTTKKILGEGDLTLGMSYNKEEFYKSIQKIRDFLLDKGYFKAEVTYKIENTPANNEVTIVISIHEGPRGHINHIIFEGFTKQEEKELREKIRTGEYSKLTSWATGSGVIKEDQIEPDVQIIVHHLQNEGYVDAHVTMELRELSSGPLALVFTLHRGAKYAIHEVSFSGETLKSEDDLRKAAGLEPGQTFSIDKIRAAQEKIKTLYTQEGYLHTTVDYQLDILPHQPEYNVRFTIEESQKYKVGLVMVSGNYHTNKNVVYNNIDVTPGDTFDSRKLKSTQEKLQSTGYFQNVNVYPVQADEHQYGASEYCDVMVEVNEAQTGHASLFAGYSSTNSIYGGIDFTENNFSLAGFRNVWGQGIKSFRGGGQFLQIKGTVGARETGAVVSWLEPYFNDTLWRFGVDLEYNWSKVVSDNFSINTAGIGISAKYPMSPYFNYGFRFRTRDVYTKIYQIPSNDANTLAKFSAQLEETQLKNNGIVSGIASTIGYDSTDNILKPHRGFRSSIEGEFGGLVRNSVNLSDFPFLKFLWTNSYYYPVTKNGTFKMRCDAKFIQPLWMGKGSDFPTGERFFLGGEGTVRGFAPGKVGPLFSSGDPVGGMSSLLLSAEYSYNLVKPLDVFVFFDAGSISLSNWTVDTIWPSYGIGARLDVGRRLPFVVGAGIPIFPKWVDKNERATRRDTVFFSMAGTF